MGRRKSYIFSVLSVVLAVLCFLWGISILLFRYLQYFKSHLTPEDFTAPSVGNVLYISSYDPSYTVAKDQLAGISDTMAKERIMYEVMYMDMLNYDSEQNFSLFYQTLKHKLSVSRRSYDAVIVSDDPALRFIEKYQDELFPRTPIVFFGVSDIDHARRAVENPWITGSIEKLFVEDTLEVIIEQNPRVSSITYLVDDSVTGKGDKSQVEKAMLRYPNLDYSFITISSYAPNELARRLDGVSKDSVAICLSSLQSYAHSNSFTVYELVDFIQTYLGGIPVYRTNTVGIGAGFVGGKIFDHYVAACRTVRNVRQILDGRPLDSFELGFDDKGIYRFDYAVLKRMRLSTGVLPSGTVFVNKNANFFEQYGKVMFPFLLISISLVLALVFFAASYTNSRKVNGVMMLMNKRMRQTNKELMDSKTKLTFVANNDGLTELPNRIHGEQELKRIIRTGVPFSLFFMDIDDFKNYNDTYTHACGDFVLQEYGRRLAKLASTNEYFAARYGGDEFILVHKCGHIEKNGKEIEALRKLLDTPVQFNGMTLDITATLGFADSEPDMSYDDLITNADIAMYEAKKIGSGSILAFAPEMKETMVRRNKIVEILKEECGKGGFEIRYQPQVTALTGDVYGFEALVRLQDYPIGPGDFIPVAEDRGFITQIGRIVTEKVLRQMDIWRSEGMSLRKVAINYSNGQIVDDEYVHYLKSLMEKYNIPPEMLEIEITESLFIGKKERAKQLFDDLSDIGVSLALDDFGTGYSSLSYLTFVPAKKVKIDKSLVDNYLVDGKESFIQNIVRLVHGLGMKLTVEGVEHKWQYDKLCAMHCDYIQGYFFSKPMTAEAVPKFTAAV